MEMMQSRITICSVPFGLVNLLWKLVFTRTKRGGNFFIFTRIEEMDTQYFCFPVHLARLQVFNHIKRPIFVFIIYLCINTDINFHGNFSRAIKLSVAFKKRNITTIYAPNLLAQLLHSQITLRVILHVISFMNLNKCLTFVLLIYAS